VKKSDSVIGLRSKERSKELFLACGTRGSIKAQFSGFLSVVGELLGSGQMTELK